MYRKQFAGMSCTIARALDEVGEWWTLLIVRECMMGSTRFDEFQGRLGIARNVLAARLARLIELGILERYPLGDRANTDGYRLTRKGEELYPVLVSLLEWGDRWLAANGKKPLDLADDETDRPILIVDAKDGSPRSFRNVRLAPAPAAAASAHADGEPKARRTPKAARSPKR